MIFLALIFSASAVSASLDDRDLAASAVSNYLAGLETRDDSAKAKPLFRQAAAQFEQLWKLGVRNPRLAQNMAQAQLLAGDVARAVAAYQMGLRLAPHDSELRAGLAFARGQVQYPVNGNLAESARPRDRSSLLRIAAADDLRLAALVLYFLASMAIARAWMTRLPGWWMTGALFMLLACATAVTVWLDERRFATEQKNKLVIVLENGSSLYRGNGGEYPRRFSEPFPAGVELHVLAERGGWYQVQLAGGEVGWISRKQVVDVD